MIRMYIVYCSGVCDRLDLLLTFADIYITCVIFVKHVENYKHYMYLSNFITLIEPFIDIHIISSKIKLSIFKIGYAKYIMHYLQECCNNLKHLLWFILILFYHGKHFDVVRYRIYK